MTIDTSDKLVQISLDGDESAPTWRTFPGPAGNLSVNGEAIDDTIFGAAFSSQIAGLITWSLNTSAIYKDFAGYLAVIKKSGSATSFTTEACSTSDFATYQIDDVTKRVWSWETAHTITVYDDAVEVSSDYYTINHMHGKITFTGAGVPSSGSAVTVSGYYLPMTAFGSFKEFTLTQTLNAVDATSFDVAQANGGYTASGYGLKTIGLSMSGFYAAANDIFDLLNDRDTWVIEINPEGSAESIARGIFNLTSKNQDGNVGDNETESAEFVLYVPTDVTYPFSWHHETTTTLHQSIQDLLSVFENNSDVWIRYLPDGSLGFWGKAVLTDCSLSGGISDVNTFTANFQGNGALTEIT